MRAAWRRWVLAAVVMGLATGAGCSSKPVPPPVVAPGQERYPEYPRPELSPDLRRNPRLGQLQTLAWAQLQSGDPRAAERTARDLITREPRAYASLATLGFARLAQGDEAEALQWFDKVLAVDARHVPALVGRGEALVQLGREGEAFEAYQSVLEVVPDQPVALRRVAVLRLRAVQSDVAAAQAALAANRLEEAREHYGRAIKASPDSAFLQRDLAAVEQRLGNTERARALVEQALSLDPQDARAHALRGELRQAAGQAEAAIADYRRALELDPGMSGLATRIAEIEAGLIEAALPAEFKAIATTQRVTRGETAALLAQRLPGVLQGAARGAVLITDSRRHWAQQAILLSARAGAMEVYPNHTFQPGAPMTRGEFAAVVSRVLNLIAARAPQAAQGWREARLAFADVRPGHRLHAAISRAVASGVLQPVEGQTFGVSRPMSGADAVEAVDRLAQLAQQAGVGGASPTVGEQRP